MDAETLGRWRRRYWRIRSFQGAIDELATQLGADAADDVQFEALVELFLERKTPAPHRAS